MTRHLALIVDDEPDICELLEITLGRMDIETHAALTVSAAQKLLSKHQFDLCLTDMRLPDGNGIDLVKHIQASYPSTPVAVITAHGSMEAAVEALKAGAFDFVSKPVDLGILRSLVNTSLRLTEEGQAPLQNLIGTSDEVESLRKLISKLARSQAPVYISGESGTGKELVARLIHQEGPRAIGPFVPVNCGAIPGELMESEFFGHKKGSFTGAIQDKKGLFQTANGGTLFLDEIADLPLSMQVKLLRAIQEKSIRPVGSSTELKVDVRILTATHKDLEKLVDEEEFRQDLYYRINVIGVGVPALRDRPGDIPEFAEHILDKLDRQLGSNGTRLAPEALEAICKHPFPGNVRELENLLERATTLCENNLIQLDDLLLPEENNEESAQLSGETDIDRSLEFHLENVERAMIEKALEKNRWNKTATAKSLGITFRALRYRLKKFGLD